MIAGFLKKDGLYTYEIGDTGINALAENQVKLLKNFFNKKVLIISRELILHTKRNYPTVPVTKLKKALKLEVGEIFSIQNPQYYLRIFESKEKTTTVDIWCWKSEDVEKIKNVFPYQYVIPEDILWIEQEHALNIFKRDGVYHLIASKAGKLLGALSLADLTEKEIELFIAGLPTTDSSIRIKIHGDILTDYKGEREIERLPEPAYPKCLENLIKVDLKDFKAKISIPLNIDFLLRIPIYGLIAYAVFLYATLNNYEAKISEIKGNIAELDKKLSSLEATGSISYQSLFEDLNKKLTQTVSALSVMDLLAERIPIGCVVNRMILSEKNLELSLTYERPLDVVEFLEGAPYVKSVTMKGSPVKQAGKNYNFTLTLELESNVKN